MPSFSLIHNKNEINKQVHKNSLHKSDLQPTSLCHKLKQQRIKYRSDSLKKLDNYSAFTLFGWLPFS